MPSQHDARLAALLNTAPALGGPKDGVRFTNDRTRYRVHSAPETPVAFYSPHAHTSSHAITYHEYQRHTFVLPLRGFVFRLPAFLHQELTPGIEQAVALLGVLIESRN